MKSKKELEDEKKQPVKFNIGFLVEFGKDLYRVVGFEKLAKCWFVQFISVKNPQLPVKLVACSILEK